MVIHSSELTRESQKPSMAISTRTSNFSLPVFKWGIRKQLRFIRPDPSDDPKLSSKPEIREENEDQKQKLREEDKEQGVDVNVTEKTMMMVSNRRTRSGTCRFVVNEIEEQQQVQRRPKFSISLSRGEIEDDLFGITGNRPSQRPKKRRPKIIQRKIDAIFPGLWLADITADSYKVAEDPENGKARSRLDCNPNCQEILRAKSNI